MTRRTRSVAPIADKTRGLSFVLCPTSRLLNDHQDFASGQTRIRAAVEVSAVRSIPEVAARVAICGFGRAQEPTQPPDMAIASPNSSHDGTTELSLRALNHHPRRTINLG
jgi:hypothetical protein